MCNHSHKHLPRFVSYVVMMLLLCCGMSVYAKNQSVADAISSCATQKNSLQRLVCYDRIHTQLHNYSDVVLNKHPAPESSDSVSSGKPSTPISTSTPVTPHNEGIATTVNKTQETFGQRAVTADTMQAVIMDIKTNRNGYKTITLTNGQVWKQMRSEDRAKLSVGQTVTFEKGVFGAIYMSAENSNRQLSVKRIK